MDVLEGEGLRQVLAVLLVFGLLGAAVWKLRAGPVRLWSTNSRGAARLQSAGRLVLTPQHTVHLVSIDGREWIVATHPQGTMLLTELLAKGSTS